MPGTTGIELCAIIRRTPGYLDVPIIMLTAMTERRFLHGAYARGPTTTSPSRSNWTTSAPSWPRSAGSGSGAIT
jgi:CheY-like chemotaxis protein